MPYPEYEHWNEDADRIRYEENRDAYRDGDPTADMTDDEIKQAVYDRMNDPDYDDDQGEW